MTRQKPGLAGGADGDDSSRWLSRQLRGTTNFSQWQCRGIDLQIHRGQPQLPLTTYAQRNLSASELERADRFVRHVDADRFRWRRMLLRSIVAHRLGIDPHEVRFRSGTWGKLSVEGGSVDRLPAGEASDQPADSNQRDRLAFNLSHSQDAIAIALCDAPSAQDASMPQEVGVDVEFRRPLSEMEGMVRLVMAADEQRRWYRLSEAERGTWFFNLWAAKEAILKATGYGLSVDPRSLCIDPQCDSAEEQRLTVRGPDQLSWHVQLTLLSADARCPSGFALAIARAERVK